MWAFNLVNTNGAPTTDNTEIWVSIVVTVGVVLSAFFGAAATIYTKRASSRLTSLDNSVNGKDEDEPPLIQRVRTVERRQESDARWITDALQAIGGQLGVQLPDRRDYDTKGKS